MKTKKWTIAFASAMVLGLLAYTVTGQPPGPGEQPPRDRRGPPRGPERGERDRDFRPPPHPVMAALDADNDGELSADEIADAVAALKKLDKDGDGKLSREEMRPQFGGRGGRPGPEGPGRPGGPDEFRGPGRGGPGGPDQLGPPDQFRGPGRGGPGGPGRGGPGRGNFAERLMDLDKNGDGKVGKDELPEPMRCILEPDANKDGAIDNDEAEKLGEVLGRLRGGPPRGEGRGGRPGGPGDDRPQRPQRPQRPGSE